MTARKYPLVLWKKSMSVGFRTLGRRVFVGDEVGFQFLQEFLVVGRFAQEPHRQCAEEQGDEVVVVQTCGVLVEHEEEEERHEHHHPLHDLHLLRLFSGHGFALLFHGHETVEQVCGAEEEAEEADVVAQAPDGRAPGDETVVGGKVIRPEEALLRQLKLEGEEAREKLYFHQQLLGDKLPLSIGGGIGQSRLCMVLLHKAHIGEIQASIWPDEMRRECADMGLQLI